MAGILRGYGKTLKLCGIAQFHDQQKKFSLSEDNVILFYRSVINFIKNKCFISIGQPEVFAKSCTEKFALKIM